MIAKIYDIRKSIPFGKEPISGRIPDLPLSNFVTEDLKLGLLICKIGIIMPTHKGSCHELQFCKTPSTVPGVKTKKGKPTK